MSKWVLSLAVLSQMFGISFLNLARAGGACSLPQTPRLTQQQVQKVLTTQVGTDLLESEQSYYQLVQNQLLSDAVLLYSSTAPKIVYAEFAKDQPGQDLGYGLHVVKRLDIGDKTIFVNESWPYVRGRLQLPTEIRIRTRTFYRPGTPRGIDGGEDQYLMGRYRIGWDRADQPIFFEEPAWVNANERAQHRVGANIFNCVSCHQSGNPFADQFNVSGRDAINHEAIVQPSYFTQRIQKNQGYIDLQKYLATQNLSQDFLDRMKAALDQPVATFHSLTFAQSMTSAMCAKITSNAFDWLSPDAEFVGSVSTLQPTEEQDGFYTDKNRTWRDAVDEQLEIRTGKYFIWTDNLGIVPGPN
jgi:hypothetical protein